MSNTDQRLENLIQRVERLEDERQNIGRDIRDLYEEAKAAGYETKIIRQIVKLRRMKPEDCREQFALLKIYTNALGIPLFDL